MLWIIAPVALLTSSLLLLFICGIDNVGYALKEYYANGWRSLEEYRGTPLYLFFVSTFGAYRVVNYAEIVWLFLYLIVYKIKGRFKLKTLLSFFFKNGEARVCQVQLFASTVIFITLSAKTPVLKEIVNTNSWMMALFAVVVTVFIFFFAYIAIFAPKETIRWSELGDGWIYNFNDSNKKEVYGRIVDTMLDDAEEEAIERIREKIGDNLHIDDWKAGLDIPETRAINQSIFNAISESWEEDSLMAKFQKLMMNEQLFLQPSLTLGDVAEQLGTNKTYVSKLVNNAYNMGFPELINTLRVDYAEQYILAHRDAIQSEVAVKCGFLSASAFNNIFKKVTGVTPNIWKANIERSEHQAARK